MQTIPITRTRTILSPDQTRVLLRPFVPGDSERIRGIISRVNAIPEAQVGPLLAAVSAEFSLRHENISRQFWDRYQQVSKDYLADSALSEQRCLLIGSYFLTEYSIESAALFNPSIVPHPDQAGVPAGALRFILSLRATGEGHISSITFRYGILHPDNRIEVFPPSGFLSEPRQIPNPVYEKPLFGRKLQELGLSCEFTQKILHRLGDSFVLRDMRDAIDARLSEGASHEEREAAEGIWLLASSNYEVQFRPDQDLSDRILFPSTPSQRNGIEDARFVRFQNDDGSHIYYATFTAFDGRVVMPELVETDDFLRFRFLSLNGPAAINKGMALFPRKINGHFAMLGRQDNESLSIMFSDNVHFWNQSKPLLAPRFPWELVQIGNCGSPIETDAGWLVLSHGVGPMRRYCVGAFLLDRDDPSKVLGRLREPLLEPNANEREGYVPNVVYSCGAMLHGGDLIMPYGLADHATSFATIPLDKLLAAME